MTIPSERRNSLYMAREFLCDLLNREKYNSKTKVSEIRKKAYWVLRHYPAGYEIEKMAKAMPEMLGDWVSEPLKKCHSCQASQQDLSQDNRQTSTESDREQGSKERATES